MVTWSGAALGPPEDHCLPFTPTDLLERGCPGAGRAGIPAGGPQ